MVQAMGIGSLRCFVIDVDDLDVGASFWSEVTGLPVIGHHWFGGRFSYLGHPEPWRHEVILQLRGGEKGEEPNRAHIDIAPEHGIDDAIGRIVELGGSVRKEPSIFPRPGSMAERSPVIDWAVMRDPFGNEFCLVQDLTREQAVAVLEAASSGVTDDHGFRVAAGVTA